MTNNIMLEDALDILREIAVGDKEKEAFSVVEYAVSSYRSLYEAAEKRIQRYRDIASKPDICENINASIGVQKEKYAIK